MSRRISGYKRGEVAKKWAKLQNKKLQNPYLSANIPGLLKQEGRAIALAIRR
jgi:hypothetical protein